VNLDFDPALDFKLLLAVPCIPLVGYVLQIFLRRKLVHGDKLLTAGMFVSMCLTLWMAAKAIAATQHGEPFLHHSSEAGMEVGWLYSAGVVESWNNVTAGILYDPLGAAMLAVVGVVSFCVHLFSIGYMHGDRRYPIFFANISLFTFAMLGLVLSDNLLFLFVFWELMGLMSYLLIGHFAHDPSQPFFQRWATWASKKAFLTTRVGDVCLFVGLLIFYREFLHAWQATPAFQAALPEYHPLSFTHLWRMGQLVVDANGGIFPTWMTVAGLLVFGGTIGKSAQFPLHIWLPDAMAGPTPVSAMIHAATMVAAGIFLLGRMYPLLSPDALSVVTVIGATTGLFAATIGCVVFDLKAVLAYSTISQLGFMAAAVGLGGVGAGMFHMVTHAFFKACLFLSAGSVIHGCHHVQDMRLMGGLWRKMPVTFLCTLVSTLAIAGFYGFSGFYSKDAILAAGWANLLQIEHFDGWSVYALVALSLAACLTAFYMFRLVFMTFFHEYRGNLAEHRYSASLAATGIEGPDPHEHAEEAHGDAHDAHGHGHEVHAASTHHAPAAAAHAAHADHGHADHGHGAHEPHESPLPITIALCILALVSLPGLAWLLSSGLSHLVTPASMYGADLGRWVASRLPEALADHESHLAHTAHTRALIVSLLVAGTGIGLAILLYGFKRDWPARIAARMGEIYQAVRHKYFIDEALDACVIGTTLKLTQTLKWFDGTVIDGLVNLVGQVNRLAGALSAWFDRTFVDGAVNLVGMLSQFFGAVLRLLQTGRIQQYAAFAVGGGILTAAWLILS
jgi:NADH-quinone oxidoreductase subunit L